MMGNCEGVDSRTGPLSLTRLFPSSFSPTHNLFTVAKPYPSFLVTWQCQLMKNRGAFIFASLIIQSGRNEGSCIDSWFGPGSRNV